MKDVQRTTMRIADLTAAPYNPRTISKRALAGLRASIERFGLVQEIVVSRAPDGSHRIVGGHQRVTVLQAAGVTEAPVAIVELTDAEERALNLALNNPHLAGEFTGDVDALLKEVRATDVAAFEALRFDALLRDTVPDDPGDRAPDVGPPPRPAVAVTQPGDTWRLGEHRVLCADATDHGTDAMGWNAGARTASLLALLAARRAACVFTDPPYAIYGSSSGIQATIVDDKMVRPFFRDVLTLARDAVRPYGHVYVCCDWRSYPSWWEVAKTVGMVPKNLIVWDKGAGLGSMYGNAHELIVFFSNHWTADRMKMVGPKAYHERTVMDLNVWKLNRVTGEERVHNAQKPLDLVRRALENSTDKGEIVLDPFLGSGTTLIAAETIGRVCYGSDVDGAWCDVVVNRWERLTGRKAERLPSGERIE